MTQCSLQAQFYLRSTKEGPWGSGSWWAPGHQQASCLKLPGPLEIGHYSQGEAAPVGSSGRYPIRGRGDQYLGLPENHQLRAEPLRGFLNLRKAPSWPTRHAAEETKDCGSPGASPWLPDQQPLRRQGNWSLVQPDSEGWGRSPTERDPTRNGGLPIFCSQQSLCFCLVHVGAGRPALADPLLAIITSPRVGCAGGQSWP